MKAKVTACTAVKRSPNSSTAHPSCSVGEMYWKIPSRLIDNLLAPLANHSSGSAVIGPAAISNSHGTSPRVAATADA